ncbi:hypothetical protein BLNAU_22271 [Blattamonas nauphoetae]|uniref:Uncharacterized protein n=1 Tax=Blattamonas nauphoetae TaxID=2049346 RepID=A0ABQ9WU28_9EUKA|nr:hypothetical protein BLNAU_22271 [Blattamonas nauphoetae]
MKFKSFDPLPFAYHLPLPFKANRQSSITQQPLVHRLLHHSLALDLDKTIYQLLPGLNENLISDIAQALTERVCLVLEEIRASSSQTQMPDSLFGTSLDWKDKHTIPQQLFVALHKMILPDSETLLHFHIPSTRSLPH